MLMTDDRNPLDPSFREHSGTPRASASCTRCASVADTPRPLNSRRWADVQPPLLTIRLGTLAAFVVLMPATSAVALAGALIAVTRVGTTTTLRAP